MSDYKLWVVDTFQKGMNFANVAHELCEQTATVEDYQLEALVTRKGSLRNHDDNRKKNVNQFAYLTVKNNRFAFGHSADVLLLSTT